MVGSWWRLAVGGGWRLLAVGGWQSLGAVLNKKKIGVLKDSPGVYRALYCTHNSSAWRAAVVAQPPLEP